MKFLQSITIILLIILIAVGVNWLYYYILAKRSAKLLTQEEFREGMRTAQVIDVRERDTFNAGHIMGARNIPFTVLTQSYASIRKDKPVYLYDATRALSVRAANKLRKQGYQDISILKDGYEGWTGKVKKKA